MQVPLLRSLISAGSYFEQQTGNDRIVRDWNPISDDIRVDKIGSCDRNIKTEISSNSLGIGLSGKKVGRNTVTALGVRVARME